VWYGLVFPIGFSSAGWEHSSVGLAEYTPLHQAHCTGVDLTYFWTQQRTYHPEFKTIPGPSKLCSIFCQPYSSACAFLQVITISAGAYDYAKSCAKQAPGDGFHVETMRDQRCRRSAGSTAVWLTTSWCALHLLHCCYFVGYMQITMMPGIVNFNDNVSIEHTFAAKFFSVYIQIFPHIQVTLLTNVVVTNFLAMAVNFKEIRQCC
jgi:hypothetical protein